MTSQDHKKSFCHTTRNESVDEEMVKDEREVKDIDWNDDTIEWLDEN